MIRLRLTRRAIVAGLDIFTLFLAVGSLAVANAGGLAVRIAGVRISARTPARALLGVAVLLLIRLIVSRRIGAFGLSRRQWRRLFPRMDAEPLFARVAEGFWRRTAYASLGIALALAVLLHAQLLHPSWIPDVGDPVFSMWRVGWVTHQLAADPMHLFDANIFYPERLTLALSDSMILPALTAVPLRILGVAPTVTYNVLLLSAFWLSGIATYLLVERLTGSPRAAFIAGLTYACYSFRFDHYSHLELQMTQWMPLALLALHLFISTGRWRYAVALALAGVAQLYSSMYYAVFFFVYATTVAIALLLVYRPRIRPLVLPLLLAAAMAAVMAFPLARAFTAAQPIKGERELSEVDYYSAVPRDYLRANKYSVLWRDRLLPPEAERALFPGAAPLALGALGMAGPPGVIRLTYAASLLVSFDGSLGLHGFLYPLLHRWIAPVREIRVPARFGALVGLTLAIFTGFGARRALRWRPSRGYGHAAFAALIAFVIIDAWPALTLAPVWDDPPPFYERLKTTPGAILAELPLQQDTTRNLPYMYFSLWHWRPMVNGYSGFIPESYADLQLEIGEFPGPAAIAALRRRGVTHVSMICALSDAGCGAVLSRMDASSRLRVIAAEQWHHAPAQLYELLH